MKTIKKKAKTTAVEFPPAERKALEAYCKDNGGIAKKVAVFLIARDKLIAEGYLSDS